MTEVRDLLLQALEADGEIADSQQFCIDKLIEHDAFVGALKSLQARSMVESSSSKTDKVVLSDQAKEIIEKGSPEARVWRAVPKEGATRDQLIAAVGKDTVAIGWGHCMKRKWLSMDKKAGTVKRVVEDIEDSLPIQLQKLDPADHKALKQRKLISVSKVTVYHVRKGEKFSVKIKELAADLSVEMIQSGSWKDEEFKDINFDAMGIAPDFGTLHPLLKVRSEFREVLMKMGFQEMTTNRWVESSFWNFDSLFQPQQHPAREAHDTFFMSSPAAALDHDVPLDYLQRVKEMHEKGDGQSIGWRYDWKEEEARKNILRTHTTAVSARRLYQLAQEGFKPMKAFSIDRVFRNESLDSTHLAEFHQIEGWVADYDLTLGHLIGIIREFFYRCGITKLKFKPAYNPYTEPSMEIFSWHEGKGKYIEIGNSGMFRPEMLKPMGLPENVRVIAWGLGLERPTMIKYKLNNIRDLSGHTVSLKYMKANPAVRLDQGMY